MQQEHLAFLIELHSLAADDVQLLAGNAQNSGFCGRKLRLLRGLRHGVRLTANIGKKIPDENKAGGHEKQRDQDRQYNDDQRVLSGFLFFGLVLLFVVIRLCVGNRFLLGFGIHLVIIEYLLALSGGVLNRFLRSLLQKVPSENAVSGISGTTADRAAIRGIRVGSPANITNNLIHFYASSC